MRKLFWSLGLCFSLNLLAAETRKLTPDFYITTINTQIERGFLKSFSFNSPSKPRDCRTQIKKVLCLVDPALPQQDPLQRKCLPGAETYAPVFEKLYDSFLPSFQKMFCSLNVIFIEKSFEGTAYAGLVTDQHGKILGAQMGIRKSVLDENLKLKTWASWKEQLNFGGVTGSYQLSPDLPLIHTRSHVKGINDFLYFVVSHEFAHIFDFANKVNQMKNCPEDDENVECEVLPDTWGSIGWKSNKTPREENDFFNRAKLCFYWCGDHPLPKTTVASIYEAISKTSFMSLYATTQPWDDFADTTAYYMMSRNLKTAYWIETKSGRNYDMIRKLYSPLVKEKLDYLKKFYSRTDLLYP